jgi:DNA-binding PadR family transcriptional regulator
LTELDTSSDQLEALPLSESTFLILVSLEGDSKHGYAIMKEVESLSQGRVKLSTGTLFGAIKRLLGKDWIRRIAAVDEASDGRGRKYYTLTTRGRQVLDAETHRLQELVAIAGRRFATGAQRGVD